MGPKTHSYLKMSKLTNAILDFSSAELSHTEVIGRNVGYFPSVLLDPLSTLLSKTGLFTTRSAGESKSLNQTRLDCPMP